MEFVFFKIKKKFFKFFLLFDFFHYIPLLFYLFDFLFFKDGSELRNSQKNF